MFFLIAAGEGHPTSTIKRIIDTPNRAVNKQNRFEIWDADFEGVSADVSPDVIVGLMHTHPPGANAYPSAEDIEGRPEGMLACVLHVETRKLYWY